jgi:hypothetical protein
MDTLDVTTLARPFVWELFPPTRWDSVPAVLYRVGNESDPTDVRRRFSDAEREALTDRFIPRLDSTRTRYLAAVAIEEPRDLARPCHERPALVRALAMAKVLTGGLLLECLDDLGDPAEQLVGMRAALQLAGLPSCNGRAFATPHSATPATVTVGFLGASRGRRAATNNEFAIVRSHVEELPQRVGRLVSQYDLNRDDIEGRVKHLVAESSSMLARILDKDQIAWNKLAASSDVFGDLSYAAACEYVRARRSDGAGADRIVELLRLYGFINPAGHRGWNKTDVRQIGGVR